MQMTENQKLREALQKAKDALSLALSDVDWRKDSPTQPVIHKAYNCAHQALALPTAAPVGELARFEQFAQNCPMGKFNVARRGEGFDSSHTQIMWDAWQARAALSAGDAVDALDAARYRWLRERVGVERTSGGQGPVSCYLYSHQPAFTACLEETDAAIDAAMRKDNL